MTGIQKPEGEKEIRDILLSKKTYTAFDGEEGSKSLSELCLELLSEQKRTWQAFREGCESLRHVRERDLSFGGFSVRLLYNPGRIRSSLADVDEEKANGRRCFLCLDHLPEGQKGVLYRSEYLILCNPFPVFPVHLTVSHRDHRHQEIAKHIGIFLHLMADFGPGWTILYNGPKCGASAPDHLHFQAGPSKRMPIEKEIVDDKRRALITQVNGVLLYRMSGLGREVIILGGDDPMAVGNALKFFLKTLKKVFLINEEPLVNIAGFYEEGKWFLVIFPRRKHRPDAFFREGDARIVVSPGVIDMGGILITPVEKDFERLDKAAVENIYTEISLDGKTVEKVIEAM